MLGVNYMSDIQLPKDSIRATTPTTTTTSAQTKPTINQTSSVLGHQYSYLDSALHGKSASNLFSVSVELPGVKKIHKFNQARLSDSLKLKGMEKVSLFFFSLLGWSDKIKKMVQEKTKAIEKQKIQSFFEKSKDPNYKPSDAEKGEVLSYFNRRENWTDTAGFSTLWKHNYKAAVNFIKLLSELTSPEAKAKISKEIITPLGPDEAASLTLAMIDDELASATTKEGTLFRNDNMPIKLAAALQERLWNRDFLLRDVPTEQMTIGEHFEKTIQAALGEVKDLSEITPPELKRFYKAFCDKIDKKFPGEGEKHTGSLLFLRYINPAITSKPPEGKFGAKNSILISKMLQSIANKQALVDPRKLESERLGDESYSLLIPFLLTQDETRADIVKNLIGFKKSVTL